VKERRGIVTRMMGRIMENLRDNSNYVGDFENYLGGFPKTLGLF